MAKDNNLQDFLTDIADAIREKKGTTEKINPQDFATEIANLSSGDDSGSGSVDGKWEYYKIDRNDASYNENTMSKVNSSVTLVNMTIDNVVYIAPGVNTWITAVAIAGIPAKYKIGESVIDTGSWLGNIKEADNLIGDNDNYSFLKPITKEEFYSDNFDYPVVEN